jgi:phytoene dehydrogenase-like protein
MAQVVVIGGGLAGLVAAQRLSANGIDVTLFEGASDVGGRVGSDEINGFILDNGFQVLFPSYPAVKEELDLNALDLCSFRPGAILVRPGQRSTLADPFRDPRALTETLFNQEVSIGDKLRILRLRWDLQRKSIDEIETTDDRSIDEILQTRGFSSAFRTNFAAPFYGGITLDRSLSTSRFVFEYTFKMLTESSAAVPADGMRAIPRQLAGTARSEGASIECAMPVDTVIANGPDQVTIETASETLEADAAVVATDPASAKSLTGCEAIPTDGLGCVTQYFSLPKTQQLDTGGRLLLNAADQRPNQIAVLSDVAPAYAPRNEHLLSATFLGEQADSDEELAAAVREALASWYPENNFGGLSLLRTDRIPFAQPEQSPGFRGRRPAVDEPAGQVYLAGDYLEWGSIQGAMESGQRAAETVIRDVR